MDERGVMDQGGGDPFDRIPKAELDCHVEGTFRPATVTEPARFEAAMSNPAAAG